MKRVFLSILILVASIWFAACDANGAPMPTPMLGEQAAVSSANADAVNTQAARVNSQAARDSARATAARQATLDTLADAERRAKLEIEQANATASATRVLATEAAHIANQTATATREYATLIANNKAIAIQQQQDYQATRHADISATASISETRVVQTAEAPKTALAKRQIKNQIKLEAQRSAQQLEIEGNTKTARLYAETVTAIINTVWLQCLLILAAILGIVVLWHFLWIQRAQQMPKHIDQMLTRDEYGRINGQVELNALGAPRIKWITQPQLPAPASDTASTTVSPPDDMNKSASDIPTLPLNLDDMPHALALPLGMSAKGARHLSLNKLNHVLIGGPSGSGKTWLLHAFAMALTHLAVPSRNVLLYLFDGKQGMKFARYQERGAQLVADNALPRVLAEILNEMQTRYDRFRASGADSFYAYNLRDVGKLPHIVLIVDELKYALALPGVEAQLSTLMQMGREAGIHVIMATQFLEAKYIPLDLRGNADTRICFAVPSVHNSLSVLGSSGAEQLTKVPGRYLMDSGNARTEIQAFTVELPNAPLGARQTQSQFTDAEKQMLQIAVREGGWFKVRQIASELGIDDSLVTETANAWEGRGWLSGEKSNLGRRGKNGRAMLDTLIGLAQKERLVSAGFKSPLSIPVGDMVIPSDDKKQPTRRAARNASFSA